MSTRLYDLLASPLGELLVLADGGGLCGAHMQEGPASLAIDARWERMPARFSELGRQLGEYFAGERSQFELEISPAGSAWQARVWRALGEIPYGRTLGYGQLAARLGRPRSARAVGSANACNPISLVLPCHRLIAADGELIGYAGGVQRKRALLELERASDPPQRLYRLLGADGVGYDSARRGTLGGHRANKVYGRLDCAGAASWKARGKYVKQRVFFSDEANAIAAGFRPCGGCMRERYGQWITPGSANCVGSAL